MRNIPLPSPLNQTSKQPYLSLQTPFGARRVPTRCHPGSQPFPHEFLGMPHVVEDVG